MQQGYVTLLFIGLYAHQLAHRHQERPVYSHKLSWTTGGRHGGKTAVTINARYTDEQVKAFVNGEMENIVAHLSDDMNVEIPMP
jgi:predicted SprT family Zn-dependent metalloprotease